MSPSSTRTSARSRAGSGHIERFRCVSLRKTRLDEENVTMSDNDELADRFEEHRDHLRAVAYRMLGSSIDADDAVQETWIRLNRSDADAIDSMRGWLTTVIAR